MWDSIQYLQDPELVAKIQKYYGVKRLYKKCDNGNLSKTNSKYSSEQVSFDTRKTRINPAYENVSSEPNILLKRSADYDSVSSDFDVDETLSSDSEPETKNYIVTNLFWHYLFVVGTALGDEIFYASFIPFWFWNIDGAVGRRVVLVWTVIMYIGQGIKDIVRWPRPSCPPVIRLQNKWALEYGMPSTHAMVGISIPFSVILYTMNRYQYPVLLGVIIASVWCSVICVSRLYLGMHSVLDILVGLALALLLMIPVVPIVDALDYHLLTSHWSPFILLLTTIVLVYFYPSSDKWTPTRGDTTMVLSVCAGVHIGAWTNYQLGNLKESTLTPPYSIIWPSYEMFGLATLRTIIGFCCIIATRALCKSASYATICALLQLNSQEVKQSKNSIDNHKKITVELSYKYITYLLLGINTAYLLPNVFKLLGIERPTFYTEM